MEIDVVQENQFTGLWCGELRRKIWRLLEDPDSSTAAKVVTRWLIYHIQGVFFNWASPLDWPPQICLEWPPLNFLSVGIIFTSPDT